VLREYDLCGRSDAVEELGRQGDILQSSIDLCAGPLVHAGLFRLDDGDRLLLVIHHLVTDGVSWRILLEDLSTLYSGIGQGAAVSLPLKSDSYLCWSERLKAYANSAALSSELPYWEGVLSSSLPVLPQDYPGGGNRVSSGAGLSFELSESDTLLLGSQVHRVYNTDINDVLLAGVGLAVADSFGVAGVVVELEGHGREELFDDLDIGRTVGWFTSTYPVVLDACAGEDARAYLVRLKEQLRRVPGKGIGYGLLRYLRDGGGVLPFDMPAGRITFNYLGDFGSGVSGATGEELFLYSGAYRGRELREDYELDHALTVTGLQVSGRLRVMVDYSRSQYDDATIAGFVNRYESLLLGLIRDLAGDEGRYVTPSDLSYRGLSMSEVSALGSGGEVEDVYELSPLQEGIYYHWLAAPGTTAYVEQSSYRLKGRVDIGLLEQSYARLLSRHAILRTAFTHEYGTSTLQIVRKTVKPDFRYIQFPPGTDIESSCAAFKEQDRAAGFDLGKGSQMRLSVLDLGNQEYEFVWSHHHILMDGWCTGILVNEFYKIYHSLVNRETPVLDNLQPYVNYIRWLSLRDRAGSLQYWEQYLSGYSNLSGIPLKENNGGKASYTPKEAHLVLGAGQLSSIQALCRQLGITENTFIQCAWGYLLSRYNNTRDVVFGSVVSGRPGELDGVEHMIGLFINTVPVRIQYEDNSTVQELLRQVQQEAIEGLPYHYVQLSDVQSRSALRKDLFDHLFIYENYPVAPSFSATGTAEQGLERLELMASAVVEQTSYDFNIAAVAADGNMLITIRYNGSCYATTSIQRIKSHLANVIREFIARPHSLLQEIGYLPEEERGHLLAAAGDAAIEEEAGLTVRDLFRKQVAVRGDTIALQFKERAYSYQAIDKMSDQLAQYLLERYGLQTGDIVGIMLPRSEWLIISMLAVLKAGCAYVPIDPAYPAGRIEYIRSDSGCRTCIDLQELEKFQAAQHSYTAAGKVNVVQEQHLAYVIYTSGSTGKPKGVMIPHSAVVNFIKGITQLISFEHKRIYALTTVSFDIFVLESILPLCTGATVILGAEEEQADPAKAAAAIIAHRIQLLQCTPSRISMMLEAGENGFLKGVSDLMIGGEAFPASLLGEIKHHYPGRIFNMYGPTETTVWSAVKDLTDEAHVTIGKPIRNTQAYILDDRLRLQGVGVYGEICLAGKGVARGYLNRDALTNEKFVPNPFAGGEKLYRTGDLGRWLPDGDIECAGRIDDQVKIRGYRIEPGEIEQLLLQLEGIDQVVVAACAAPGPAGGGKVLTAYIVGRRTYAVQALKQALKQQLPEYMIPAYFIRLDKLPLTANGKLDKLALPYPGSSNVGSSAGYVAPRNKAEQALADVYRQVLNLEQVSVLDSFFDLGGDSIRTIQLINHLKRQGYKVRVTEVLQYPVIEELARQITCIAAPEGINVRPPDVPAARMPLSPNQQWYYGKNGFAHAYGTVSFRLKGFDSTTFLDTYKRWLQHYAVLRIKILEEHGLLYQELMPVPEAPAVLFLESASLDMSSAAAIAAVHKMQQDAFDLFNGEVIRCGVIHNQYEAFVYMVIHHVATDGASNVLLRDAFMQQYGKQEWTPGNNNTYFDFITAQQHYLHSADGGEKLYYWQQHLAPLAARKNGLPAEPGKLLTGIFSENRRVLAGAAYQDIRADCRQQQVLLSSLVTTWLYLYLCDARPEESLFLVGMVADGRDACLPGFDMAGAVGQFTNQVPVCLSRDACSTFGTAVRYVQERCLDGRLHQELPWAVIAADFEGRYGSALEPYMDAVVNYFDHTDTDVDLDEWQAYSKTTPLTDMPPGPCLLVICHAFRNGLVMDWHISSHSPEQEITARIIAAMTTQR
ncbi:non-ribosomal peptide synthetase, partial [Chitinophaga japonensis]|uniref:non-ribosomal peptide synthetase n=1 Tax=Chitinophaga japonensis TaxID=104662 RepID=UPI00119F6056